MFGGNKKTNYTGKSDRLQCTGTAWTMDTMPPKYFVLRTESLLIWPTLSIEVLVNSAASILLFCTLAELIQHHCAHISGVAPKVGSNTFDDLLGGHQFTGSSSNEPKTMKAMKNEALAEEMDPDKLKVYPMSSSGVSIVGQVNDKRRMACK